MSALLFNDLTAQSGPKPEKWCKGCKHIQRWACGASFFFYCAARPFQGIGAVLFDDGSSVMKIIEATND